MSGEGTRLHQANEITEEHQLSFVERGLQAFQEQPPIKSRQDANREEEVGPAADPASVGCEAAARHEAVGVRMMHQGLAPSMQNGDHAGLGAKVLWIGADDAHRLGGSLEQDVVHDRLVLERDGGDGAGTVKTRWKYGTGSRSACRSASHWARARPWHLGQCRSRQLL